MLLIADSQINLSLLLPLLISTVVAIIGWFVGHWFNAKRDLANKRRELRVQYLIDAYRKLESLANRGPIDKIEGGDAKLESALADIQLFGSATQVVNAQDFARQFSTQKTAKLDDLLAQLRQDLRKELDLGPVRSEVLYLRPKAKKSE